MVAWHCKVMFIQLALAGQFSLDHRAADATPTTASGRCLVLPTSPFARIANGAYTYTIYFQLE